MRLVSTSPSFELPFGNIDLEVQSREYKLLINYIYKIPNMVQRTEAEALRPQGVWLHASLFQCGYISMKFDWRVQGRWGQEGEAICCDVFQQWIINERILHLTNVS